MAVPAKGGSICCPRLFRKDLTCTTLPLVRLYPCIQGVHLSPRACLILSAGEAGGCRPLLLKPMDKHFCTTAFREKRPEPGFWFGPLLYFLRFNLVLKPQWPRALPGLVLPVHAVLSLKLPELSCSLHSP